MFASKNQLITGSGGYEISRSVRLRASASASFSRTPAGASDRRTWTWSAWVKRGSLSSVMQLFEGYGGASSSTGIYFNSSDGLQVTHTSGSLLFNWGTNSVYRDPSAWYHIVLVFDTTQASSSNRIALYVNGVKITSYGIQTTGAQNTETFVNSTNVHYIGRTGSGSFYFDGYITEVNFINAQALTPSSFGKFNSVGVWSPIKYAGTYGTNGYYLNFSNNSGLTNLTIGRDYSGNGNGWTPSNVSITAGVTYDSMLDVPTPFADGDNGRGNYCVLNPLSSNASFIPTG